MSSQGNVTLKSFVWKASERLMVQGLGLFIQIVLARLLMPEDFACVAIINAIVNFLGLFVQCGLSVVIIQKPVLTEKDISTLTTISLLIASVLFTALFFAAPFISNYYDVGNLVWPIRVMGLSLFLYSFNSIQTGLLTRKMQFRTIFFRSMLATPLAGLVGVGMAYMGLGIWALIGYSVTNIFTIVIFMNMIPELRLKIGFSKQSAKEMYPFTLKILGTNLVSTSGDTIRTMTIGKVYSADKLAYYDRAYSYSALVTHVVTTSLSSVLLPVFSRSQEDIIQLKEMARKSVGLASFILMPILIGVAVIAEPLVSLLLTDKWLPCAPFLSLFCLLRIPGIITSVDKQVYLSLGKSQVGLYYEIFLLIVNLISLWLLIPYGVFAIAIGYTVVEFVGNLVLCIVSRVIYNYLLRERVNDLFKPTLSALVMALAGYAIGLLDLTIWVMLILQIVVCAVVYVCMSAFIKDANLVIVITKLKSLKNK